MENKSLTVSQLNKYISGLMEFDDVLSNLTVKGEISNFKRHSSGHLYFSIKDDDSKISCVMFKSAAYRLDFDPIDGINVMIKGRVSVYEKNGTYQIYVEKMNEDGIGSLYERYNRLLDLLKEKGYFDPSRKKQIPFLPKRVAVVTSPTGAAVRDLISIMKRRFPAVRILVCPVLVQGESAPLDIALMIDLINKENLADLIITGRGGGSIEELWAFNERVVAESIFKSHIPVISAVGHETDFTIADFVADLRAATPSAAAELAVPDVGDVRFAIDRYRRILEESLQQMVAFERQRLKAVSNLSFFAKPLESIEKQAMNIDYLSEKLTQQTAGRMQLLRSALNATTSLLNGLSYENVLKRGYCVLSKNGEYVSSNEIERDDEIDIIAYNEIIDVNVKGKRKRSI
ncbi:MAG: exodeoxyribonuclease VII large subunit [Anaerofustis sp.]